MSCVPDFPSCRFAPAQIQFENVRAEPWVTPEGISVAPVQATLPGSIASKVSPGGRYCRGAWVGALFRAWTTQRRSKSSVSGT